MKVRPNSGTMKIMGRTTQADDVLYLGFSASYVEFETTASRIRVTMRTDDEIPEKSLLGWFAVYLDDAAQPAVRRALTHPEEEFVIFEEERPRKVKLRLVKMSEAAFGLVGIKEFEITCGSGDIEHDRKEKEIQEHAGQDNIKQECIKQGHIGKERIGQEQIKQDGIKQKYIRQESRGQENVHAGTDGDACVTKTPDRPRRIEVIGDSITCGYGNEGVLDRDTFTTAQENPEEAYAVLTANALNADYQLVSWSGIGVITNWIPEDVNEPLEEILMPDLYPYRDRRLCEKLGLPLTRWDSAWYAPDLIVLHLGTNDDSYVRKISERQAYFGEKYYAFLEQIHEQSPQAAILCTLGVMGQNLCEEEARQTERFAGEHPEVRIDYLVLPEQDRADGIGADSHPSKLTHRKTAAVLTEKIREFMGWQD